MTVHKNEKFALDVYFNNHNDENLIYYPSSPPHAWSIDSLALPPNIEIMKSTFFCRAALAMTRRLPPTDEYKLINQERERM